MRHFSGPAWPPWRAVLAERSGDYFLTAKDAKYVKKSKRLNSNMLESKANQEPIEKSFLTAHYANYANFKSNNQCDLIVSRMLTGILDA
jgi:hypothetical protein